MHNITTMDYEIALQRQQQYDEFEVDVSDEDIEAKNWENLELQQQFELEETNTSSDNSSNSKYFGTHDQLQAHSVQNCRDHPYAISSNPETTEVSIPVQITCLRNPKFNETVPFSFMYHKTLTIGSIISSTINILQNKHKPVQFQCIAVHGDAFGFASKHPSFSKRSITEFDRNELIQLGIKIHIERKKYQHTIDQELITCPDLGAEKCPIYHAVKNQYDCKQTHLSHLMDYTHSMHELENKPLCDYASNCFAFRRLQQNGQNPTRLDDLCHIELYRHPPIGNVKVMVNVNPLLINTQNNQNHPVYCPTKQDEAKYEYDAKNGYLKALVEEVANNGHKQCLEVNDEEKNESYSLLDIVDQKMNVSRHKQMGSPLNRAQMLAIILYTGTECSYKICQAQRNGDYITWKWFDFCLFNAIELLSRNETGKFTLYSGFKKVKLNRSNIKNGCFKTYQSSSWKLDIAKRFVQDSGMIIVMNEEFRKHTTSCDVSWISKFHKECEVLISRTSWRNNNRFSLKIIDQRPDIDMQIVLLQWKG
eukprot:263586_1